MMKYIAAGAALLVLLLPMHRLVEASIPTCALHKGMHIWYLDYADDDVALAHPLGVREGVVDINDHPWHEKCARDGPYTKLYVPFIPLTGRDKGSFDTRWPQDVYRTRAEANRAYLRSR
jgi:hypothetical protein